MSNDGITKPTVGMLPMQEIKDELLRSFRNENKIELEKMAVIYDGDLDNINEKDTVKNSKLLDGKTSSEYALHTDMQSYDKLVADDLLQLRSELYSLKNELIQNSAISHSGVENGFQDPMRRYHIVYDKTSTKNDRIVQHGADQKSLLFNKYIRELDKRLHEGDFVALHLSTKNNVVDKVEAIENKRLVLENKDLKNRHVRFVSKNTGEYDNGYYHFINKEIDASSGDIKVSGFNDGRNKYGLTLSNNNVGLLHTFFLNPPLNTVQPDIDSESTWILKKTLVNATPKTDSGQLRCHIIAADNYSDIQELDLQSLTSNDQDVDVELVATSAPVYAKEYETGFEHEIYFDFNEKDVELKPGKIYGMIILHTDNSPDPASNVYWEVTTSFYTDTDTSMSDEHKSNELFVCENIDATLYPLKRPNLDLQYQIYVEEKTHVEIMPHTEGLYTAYFSNNINSSKALLSMRVKREGLNYYEHNGISMYPKGSTVPIINSEGAVLNVANTNDYVVIGDNIRKVVNSALVDGKHNLILSDDVYIDKPLNENKVIMYRLGYKVYLSGYKKNKQTDSLDHIGTTELKLSKVIQDDFDNITRGYSDRVLFESIEEGNKMIANSDYYKVQIVWNSVTDNNRSLIDNKTFTGGIRDLNISFVRDKKLG